MARHHTKRVAGHFTDPCTVHCNESTSEEAWEQLLSTRCVTGDSETADLHLLVGALADKLRLTCEINMCHASHTGTVTIFKGLQRLGFLIAGGPNRILLCRQTAEGPRLLGDHFPSILAAFTALLREGQSW